MPWGAPRVGKTFNWPWNFPVRTRLVKHWHMICNVKFIATQWHVNSYQLCVHSAGQCSTSQSINIGFAYARGKSHWRILHLLANELWKMPDKLCSLIREYVMFIFTKSLLFYSVDYVLHTGRRFTVSNEMKTKVTWIYSASHFASVEGEQGFILQIENHSG